MVHKSEYNWRQDPGLKSTVIYRKKFAYVPVMCNCGTKVWLKNYYTKYIQWGYKNDSVDTYGLHEDFCENITEAEYIIVKLQRQYL